MFDRFVTYYQSFILLDDELKANDPSFSAYAKEIATRVCLKGSLILMALVILAWPIDLLSLRTTPALMATASFWRTIQVLNCLGIAVLFSKSSWARRNSLWLSVIVVLSWEALWPALRLAAYTQPSVGVAFALPVAGLFLVLPFFQRLMAAFGIVIFVWFTYLLQFSITSGEPAAIFLPRSLTAVTFCVVVIGHIGYKLLRSNFSQVFLLERRVNERTTELRELVADQEMRIEKERSRISGELHDVLGQIITRLRISVDILSEETSDPSLRARIFDISEKIDLLVGATREAIHELRPEQMGDGMLTDIVEDYLTDVRAKCGVDVTWHFEPARFDMDPGVKIALLRIVQEATNNALKHAKCKQLAVRLLALPEAAHITLEIHDDGPGIEAGGTSSGLGLIGMRQRAERLGGAFQLVRSELLGGAAVSASIPVRVC